MLFALNLSGQQTCYTPAQVAPLKAMSNPDPLNGDYCVTVYVEVDHDIVIDKGHQGSRDYVNGFLAEVNNLYQAQGIALSFIVKYWDVPSPYSSSTSSGMLRQFRANTATGHDGDVAHLISYQASGGVAYVDAICSASFGHAFSSIVSNYAPYPRYSWSVEVFAHELGHNLGSPHTQSCVWNGNQTAIDGCSPFGTEGGCDDPWLPVGGGTVMSYCHLNSAVGINFEKGFHPQPLALIKNRIANAQCVECTDEPDDPDPEICEGNQVIIELQLDNYAQETSWEVLDSAGAVVGFSEPFAKNQMNTYHADTLCLPDGCYTFVIKDVDGIGGYGCSEGMYIVSGPDGEVASGQSFEVSEITGFCFNVDPPDRDCSDIVLRADGLTDYANQSRSPWAVITDVEENGVDVFGNNWRAKAYEYTITASSVLTADVWVDTPGEINGIGISDNLRGIYPDQSWRFAGSQAWGVPIEQVRVGEWTTISIPIGRYHEGFDVTHIVLINDDDRAGLVKTAWKNVEICEGGWGQANKLLPVAEGLPEDERKTKTKPFPNPVMDTLNIGFDSAWHLYDSGGRLTLEGWGNTVPMGSLPRGLYILHDGVNSHKIIKK